MKLGNNDITLKLGSSDVSAAYLGSTLVYSSTPVFKNYLRFISRGSGAFTFFSKDNASANTLSYSLNSGMTWNSLPNSSYTVSVSSGDVIMWKGSDMQIRSNAGIGTFAATTDFDVEGNIMSLLYGDEFEDKTSLSGKDYVFMNLFSGCTNVINAENLELPATTLSTWCYCNFFNRASGLTTSPTILPATTLADNCYRNMFIMASTGQTSLTTSPLLPAPILTQYCYNQMFNNCKLLTSITCLATDKSASNCLTNWVANVASSGTFTKDYYTSWTRGNSAAPTGWTIKDYNTPPSPTHNYANDYLTFVPLESCSFSFSKTGASYSLDGGTTWTSLAASASTPTVSSGQTVLWKGTMSTTLTSGIGTFSSSASFDVEGNAMSLLYGDNFIGQTSLSGKKNAFRALFQGCTHLKSAENLILPATTLAENSYYNMFSNCSSLTTAPTLSATTLTSYCYYNMFYNCASLNSITCLATDISATNCTSYWLNGVASTGTFRKAASMNDWTTGYSGIPSNWTVIDYSS